jgi:hypothetical protein
VSKNFNSAGHGLGIVVDDGVMWPASIALPMIAKNWSTVIVVDALVVPWASPDPAPYTGLRATVW